MLHQQVWVLQSLITQLKKKKCFTRLINEDKCISRNFSYGLWGISLIFRGGAGVKGLCTWRSAVLKINHLHKKTLWYLGQYIANGYMSLKTSLSIHCTHGPSRQILVLNLLMWCINNHHSAFQGQKFLIPVYLCLQCTIMRCLSFLHNN